MVRHDDPPPHHMVVVDHPAATTATVASRDQGDYCGPVLLRSAL